MKTNIRLIKTIWALSISVAVGATHQAFAGPLRDRLIERELQHQQEEMLDAAGDSGSASRLPQGVRVIKDVSYGVNRQQRMDIYVPAHASHAPVIFMVHGGGWRHGDKTMQSVVENKVARWVPKGFIFISIDYRMLPDTDVLKQADEVVKALAFAQSHAASWGGDAAKFILMGHSAGAHLVSLVSANTSKTIEMGARRWLGTVSLDSAALDVVEIMQRKHFRLYDPAFGKDANYWKSASPVHQLIAGAKPIMAVCSSTRPDQPCTQAHEFADKASSLGIKVTVLEQPKSHRKINQELGLPGAYTDAAESFMAGLDQSVKARLMPNASKT
jgi:acetyl esterase/lipase